MDPAGEFVFVANSVSNNVTVFSFDLDTGALTAVPGSPFPAGSAAARCRDGWVRAVFYVANNLSNSSRPSRSTEAQEHSLPLPVRRLRWETFYPGLRQTRWDGLFMRWMAKTFLSIAIGVGGGLTPVAGSPLDLRIPNGGPTAIAVDPSGQFLLVTQRTRSIGQNDTVSSFHVNSNGSLTPVGTPIGIGEGVSPSAVAVDPGGQWVYVANQFGNSTAGFSLHPTTGVLTPIPGSSFQAGPSPLDVAVMPAQTQSLGCRRGFVF